jgi:glycine/D-amino acid oxidase-like deaminating enzyme
VTVFIHNAAHHVRDFVDRTVTGRPVGDGQACIIAGDERSGDNQDKGAAGGEDGEAMQPAIIWNLDAFQNAPMTKRRAAERPPKRNSLPEGGSPIRSETPLISQSETGSEPECH